MENFKRELERNRVKKDLGDKSGKKWSVLFISSTGKVYNLNYIRSFVFVFFGLIFFLAVSVAVLFSALAYEKNNNKNFAKKIEISDSKFLELKNKNEQLRIKLAFLKQPDNTIKSSEIYKEKINNTSNEEEIKVFEKIGDFSKIPLEIKNIDIENIKDFLKVNFELINISKSKLTISGHVFVMLKNSSISDQHWMISPYSQISGGKPLKPLSGQFFSIMRFKPVTIKFPGISNTGRFNVAEIFVFSEDGELVLKKGFDLNED